ncbi:MAG: glycosyltransferase [Acidobacteriaceae bacterium]
MNTKNQHILLVLHDIPYPPRGGGRVDMWGRIQALRRLGHSIDVAIAVHQSLSDECRAALNKFCDQILIVPRRPFWQGLWKTMPFQVFARSSLADLKFVSGYDCVLLEAESVAGILKNTTLQYKLCVLRTHNIEADYFLERSKVQGSTLLTKIYDRVESRRYEKYSRNIMQRCDAIWWVSLDEMFSTCKAVPELIDKSSWLPHFYDPQAMHVYPYPDGQKVLFVGALSSPQNIEAILWYIENIHESMKCIPGYRLVIAGGTDGRMLPKQLISIGGDEACQVLTDVSDLRSLYKSCRVFINPVQHGAGINSKTIHAICDGLPIVTTTPGYRGTGLEDCKHVLVADTPDSFAHAIKVLLKSHDQSAQLVASAQDYLLSNYNHYAVLEELISKILPQE